MLTTTKNTTTTITTNNDTADSLAPTVVATFLEHIGAGRFDALPRLLAPDLWMRSLLVRDVHETKTREHAVEALRGWLGSAYRRQLVDWDQASMEGREYLRYRFRLRPDWDPDHWYLIEQVGYCRVADGIITRLDLVCTGYHRVGKVD